MTHVQNLRDLLDDTGLIAGDDLEQREPGIFTDTIRAQALLRPSTTEQVSNALRYCNEHNLPVVTHGGLTNLVRGGETRTADIILSLERMNTIEHIDAVGRTVLVQAGVVLQTLQEELAKQGLDFPLDLGARGSCQLGGNAATNAGGQRVLRYGMMRELTLGVEAVLADGTVVSSLNEMLKNNTGYDIKQLFIGSEGTLGVITRLILKLVETPRSRNTAMVAVDRFEQVANLLKFMDRHLAGQLSAFEVLWSSFYRYNGAALKHFPIDPDYKFYVVLESLGADQERDQAHFQQALEKAFEQGLVEDAVVAQSEKDAHKIWQVRDNIEALLSRPLFAYDVSLPIREMEDYVAALEPELQRRLPGCDVCTFGHLADGNLHVVVMLTREQAFDIDSLHQVSDETVYERLSPIGGSISAEHGIGLEKKAYLHLSRQPAELVLMKTIKKAMDPKNILNPGKIF